MRMGVRVRVCVCVCVFTFLPTIISLALSSLHWNNLEEVPSIAKSTAQIK